MNQSSQPPHTLAIDIGGSGIKAMILDKTGDSLTERLRIPTPDSAKPEAVMDVICTLANEQGGFDRVSVGFPGVVEKGITKSAPNLDDDWLGFNLEREIARRLQKPTRVKNDAEIQGFGAISGEGIELVITLGTGFGSALFHDGQLMPNLELAHHNFRKGKTYEQQLRKKALKKKGKKKWNKRLSKAIASLAAAFHYDRLYIGGGRAKKIDFDLPDNVQTIPNVAGILGGIALWKDNDSLDANNSLELKDKSIERNTVAEKTTSNEPVIIEPSILSANFANLGKGVLEAQAAGAKAIQIDIMDGQFVPNISFGWDTVAAIRPLTDIFLDVHLMIVEPERYIDAFAQAGADRLIVHQETCTHLHRVLSLIKKLGIEAGVTVNPGTSINKILPVLDLVDLVQIMTVNPGFGGQSFIHSQLEKITSLKQTIQEQNLDVAIAVDGSINPETAPLVVQAGATVLVAGSSVYNSQASVKDNLSTLFKAIER